MKVLNCLILFLSIIPSSLFSTGDIQFKPGKTYTITSRIDLKGTVLTVPNSVVLLFRGGSIENGTIRFNRTTLSGDVKVFAHIHPKSTLTNTTLDCSWFTPNISCGTKGLDSSETINELINITINYSDGQYDYTPIIYLPAGVYYCKSPINISSVVNGEDKGSRTISIRGEEGTKIVAFNKMEYLFGRPLSESSSLFSGVSLSLENITFDGNLRVDNTLNLSRVSYSSIKNVKSIGGCLTNLYMSYSFVNLFEHCIFKSWDVFRPTNIDVFLGPQEVNAISFISCVFEGANVGVYCGSGYVANFDGCTFEGLRRTAVYIYRTNQVNIRGCYFEENATTKNSKLRKDFDWNTFGISGTVSDSSHKKLIKVHSDIVINNYKMNPEQNWSRFQFVDGVTKVQKLGEVLGNVTLIGNSVQRINSCSNDNVYGYTIPNESFVFVADDRPVTAISNSIVSIYSDEKKGIWRYSKNYQSPVLLKAEYSKRANTEGTSVFMNNNSSANINWDKAVIVEMY